MTPAKFARPSARCGGGKVRRPCAPSRSWKWKARRNRANKSICWRSAKESANDFTRQLRHRVPHAVQCAARALALAQRCTSDAGPRFVAKKRNRGPGSAAHHGASLVLRCARDTRDGIMKDFWLSCGHHLLDRDAGGGLLVTDEFLKAYLARPELTPPPDACAAERRLHAAMLADPRRRVTALEIAGVADADARENWQLVVAFRDHLLQFKTLEAAYAALARGGIGRTPPLFLDHLVHLILRNVLDGCDDPFVLRAAELFFRQ